MIRVHTETNRSEDYTDFPTATVYNFTDNGNWIGIFDGEQNLLATFATRFVVSIRSVESVEPAE